MSDSTPREEAILEAARLLPAEQRAAYLDKLCGASGPERERIDRLINSQAKAGKTSASEVPASPAQQGGTIVLNLAPAEKAGDRIGPYKLLQPLGEGGCGAVYMAEQEQPVRRRVALKVIKLGMDTKSVIARFEAERQALALMDHPNIAKVLDAGATETGRPFFVMELVRGIKITDYCDQNKLSIRERLELFIQICHAIQHAHQKGIIHRDIKPSNILVTLHDGVPVPKVIDFGIAKATDQRLTDKTLFTQFEQFIGTPAYMSPEQAEMSGLDVDTRSDIYSLGVLLYELLTGRTPFDPKELMQSGLDAMRRTIREKEPARPSTRLTTMAEGELATTAQQHRADAPKLVNLIRGDLDWIVMKTLEKDRTRRYETANGLALDIQRYMNSEPISARPPSNWYRLQKLVRRHKTTTIAVASVAATIVLGFAACLYLFIQERDAHRRAAAAEKEQARLREKAEAVAAMEANLRKAAEVGEKYSRAGMLLSRGQYDEAEKITSELPVDPNAVPFYNAFMMLHGARGEWLPALTNCELLDRFCTASNSPLRETVPSIYHSLAPLLVQNGDLKGYRELRGRILQEYGNNSDPVICERLSKDCLFLPPENGQLETLVKMTDRAVATDPSHRSYPYFAFSKGLAEYRRGRYSDAADWLQKALVETNDSHRTAMTYGTLAMAQQRLGRTNEAKKTLEQGVVLAKARLPQPSKGGADDMWNDWIVTRALLREASDMIQPELQNGTGTK
jgi:serine/threonine protein kinase